MTLDEQLTELRIALSDALTMDVSGQPNRVLPNRSLQEMGIDDTGDFSDYLQGIRNRLRFLFTDELEWCNCCGAYHPCTAPDYRQRRLA